jgi:hypothetical protein
MKRTSDRDTVKVTSFMRNVRRALILKANFSYIYYLFNDAASMIHEWWIKKDVKESSHDLQDAAA